MTKTSFYPHMVVGNITKKSKDTNSAYNITINSSQFSDISVLIAAGDKYTQIVESEKAYVQEPGNSTINTKTQLIDYYQRFNIAVEILAATKADDLILPFDTSLIGRKDIIENSYIRHYIINENKNLVYDLFLAIKLIALFEKIENSTLTTKEAIFDFWKKAKIILPSTIFPLPQDAPTVIEIPTPTSTPVDLDSILEELKDLNYARNEILTAFHDQNESKRRDKISKTEFKSNYASSRREINPELPKEEINLDDEFSKYVNSVSPEDLSKLKLPNLDSKTKDILLALKFESDKDLNVPHSLKKIDIRTVEISNLLSTFDKNPKVLLIGNSLIEVNESVYENAFCHDESKKSICALLNELSQNDPAKSTVQILGEGYANIIKQELVRYEATEICHIENILAGEEKTKTHRNLKRTEDYSSYETETSEETTTDNATSERFELANEVNKMSSSASQFEAGLSVSGSYGPVSLSANVGYATQNANSEAEQISVKNSKEITTKATHKIQTRTKEFRSSLTVNEVEVTNLHKIENTSTEHINGFYYWVDKIYSNQVYNIGRRLMLECMIPEPAAYYIYSKANSKKEGVTIDKPVHPAEYKSKTIFGKKLDAFNPLKSFSDIDRSNYKFWAAKYNVQDIVPPPQDVVIVSLAKSFEPAATKHFLDVSEQINITSGYKAISAIISAEISSAADTDSNKIYINGQIGNVKFNFNNKGATHGPLLLSNETGIVPLSFRAYSDDYAMNIQITCTLLDTEFEKWKIRTYNSIMNAYSKLKSEYDNQVSSIETSYAFNGTNPTENKKIEQTELKKWAIEMLTIQRFTGFNAMKWSEEGIPEIDFNESFKEAKFVKFFEQAIEWGNMTYLYYPYFWTSRKRWEVIKEFNDSDTNFSDFLKAGYARVVVPVHPKFTEAIYHYLKTGEIWMGEEMPVIDDDLYISIVDEIVSADVNPVETPVGLPWETKIPTNLIVLSSVIPDDLPGSGS